MSTSRAFGENKKDKKGYIVLVLARLAPGQVQGKFIPIFKPLAAHVAQHEEGCSAYELSVNLDDPDRFIIYERYISKEYVEQVHWQSEAYKTFKKACEDPEIQWLEKSIVTYYEQDIGF